MDVGSVETEAFYGEAGRTRSWVFADKLEKRRSLCHKAMEQDHKARALGLAKAGAHAEAGRDKAAASESARPKAARARAEVAGEAVAGEGMRSASYCRTII